MDYPPRLLRVGELLVDGALSYGPVATLYLARSSASAARSQWRHPMWLGCKVVDPHVASVAGVYDSMVTALRAAVAVRTPHLELVHSIGFQKASEGQAEPREVLAITCELARGLDLHRIAKELRGRDRVPLTRLLLGIVWQGAQGLAAAHARPEGSLVHGGLTPARVRLTYGGLVKLVDYALVAGDEIAAMRTNAGPDKGLFYKDRHRLETGGPPTPADDVWSLGVITWELFAGRELFVRPDMGSSLECWKRGEVPRLAELGQAAPAGLDDLLQAVLARAPGQRLSDAARFANALRALSPTMADAPELAAWLATDLERSRTEETRVFERCAAESPHGFDPPRHLR